MTKLNLYGHDTDKTVNTMCSFYSIINCVLMLFFVSLIHGTEFKHFVNQRDVSEYCKRRVVPSVFLGRQVVAAHSQILHFSKTDLPYSCFISVRAEPGSNVILVIQVSSVQTLFKSCAQSPNQLVVYEMGETFGGYWGALPQSILTQEMSPTELYTLKTTGSFFDGTTIKYTDEEEEITTNLEPDSTSPASDGREEDVIVEVPIVNVSSGLEKNILRIPEVFDEEDNFNLLYDVTPRRGENYDVSIMPMVQFSINNYKNDKNEGRKLYDLSYRNDFTQDARLKHTYNPMKTAKPRNYWLRRHKNILTYRRNKKKKHNKKFKKINKGQARSPDILNSILPLDRNDGHMVSWKQIEEILNTLNKTKLSEQKNQAKNNISYFINSLSHIKYNNSAYLYPNLEESLKNFPENYYANLTTPLSFRTYTKKPLAHFIQSTRNFIKLFNPLRNYTAVHTYANETTMTQQLGILDKHSKDIKEKILPISENVAKMIMAKTNTSGIKAQVANDKIRSGYIVNKSEAQSYTNQLKNILIDTNNSGNENITVSTHYQKYVQNATLQYYKESSSSTKSDYKNGSLTFQALQTHRSSPMFTASLVDHESWENIVKVAPVMVDHLNQTSSDYKGNTQGFNADQNGTKSIKSGRRKRRIKSISILNAHPHTLTTQETTLYTSTEKSSYGITDLQEFAQQLELQDDELHDRVALRYLRQYVGPPMYNICDYKEAKVRHIYLFNSSRIVLALSNFTIDRMTVTLTPAHTLFTGNAKCVKSSLECQVFGTRVCIDALNACDGVPNCGSYDIYDEDRMTCSVAKSHQNVYVAAITSLALLMTLFYSVHYWLRRCVPRVSEAFFIYTDRAENILYLETIMRSPYDTGSYSNKLIYHDNLLAADDILFTTKTSKKYENICYRTLRNCLAFMTCTRNRRLSQEEQLTKTHRQTFSFAEHELNMMLGSKAVDASIQTGESIEMAYSTSQNVNNFRHCKNVIEQKFSRYSLLDESDIERHVNELNLLKFMKDSKSEYSQSNSFNTNSLIMSINRNSNEEVLIKTHTYDEQMRKGSLDSTESNQNVFQSDMLTSEVDVEIPGPSKKAKKHLRFEDLAITIPNSDVEDVDGSQQSSIYKEHPYKSVELEKERKEGDSSFTSGRDFKRFWTVKSKKSKKKTYN